MFRRSYFFGSLYAALSATQLYASDELSSLGKPVIFHQLEKLSNMNIEIKKKLLSVEKEFLEDTSHPVHFLAPEDFTKEHHEQDKIIDMSNYNLIIGHHFTMDVKYKITIKANSIILRHINRDINKFSAPELSLEAINNIVLYNSNLETIPVVRMKTVKDMYVIRSWLNKLDTKGRNLDIS